MERKLRRAALVAVIAAADMQMDNTVEILAYSMLSRASISTALRASSLISKRRGSAGGRRWAYTRNDPFWLFRYALQPQYIDTADWRAMFRIRYTLFSPFTQELRPSLEARTTNMRLPVPVEKKIAAFLMFASSCTYRRVSNQLGLGVATVHAIVREVPRAICKHFRGVLCLPQSETEIAAIMRGFQSVAELPYCVGATDGSHIPWNGCPKDQYYEYRCYKGFQSLVLFALSTANRRIIYADVGYPGVLGDSTIFQRSRLHTLMTREEWPGSHIPSLYIGNTEARPYILGDCAFSLSRYVMKTCSKDEIRSNPILKEWDRRASSTRKPVECAFGILKGRFSTLKSGISLQHEDDAVFLILSCLT